MSMGYHQIKIKNEDQDKTSFITKHGTFSYKRLPFGLCNSGATFSRVIALVLRGVPPEVAKAYLDDIIILGRNFTEHLKNMITVFEKFDENHLKFKPKKCLFFRRQTKYLGRVISDKGISVDPAKTECIQNWPLPKDKTQLQKFLGFCNYHREFIKSYAEISSVLYDACTKFVWTDMHTKAFNDLQRALTSPACLAYPTEEGIYVLDTDASNDTIGAELLQVQEGVERTIAYASYKLLKQQKNYCTTRKELLSVVAFTRYFRHYLIGQSKFYVRTDHSSLAWLTRFKEPQGQLARWLEELAQYNMEILHRKGQKHIDADSLSRIPDNLDPCDCYSAGEKLQDLPCKGCKFCERAHKQWFRFLTDVDDIVPLSRNQHSAKFDVHIVNDMNKLIKDGGSTEVFTVQHPRDTIDFTSSLGFTSEELSTLQWRDPNLLPIMMYARDGTELSQQELELHGPAVQSMWLCRKYFLLRDGVLHYRWLGRSDREYVLVVPKSTVDLVISLCHDDKTAGHLSHEKTLFRLKQRFFWYNMSLQCLLYCRGCEVCNRSKKLHQKNKPPIASIIMEILGPFVTSSDGNKYVLTIVDQFSKWVTMTAMPDHTAETVAHNFLVHYMCTFGAPLFIHTDQGAEFNGSLFECFCKLFQITKTRTTPHHPSSNGQCERYNSVILQMIRCYIDDASRKSKDWDKDLPLFNMALHSMVHRNTGFTANQLMLGREVFLPVDLVMGTSNLATSQKNPCEWIQHQEKVISKMYEEVRDKLKASQQLQKRTYDLTAAENLYELGDLILRKQLSTKTGAKALKPVWEGPFVVTECRAPLYKVKNQRRDFFVHHDNIKRCNDRSPPLWARRMRHEILALDNPPLDIESEAEKTLALPDNDILMKTEDDEVLSEGDLENLFKVPTPTRAGRHPRPPRWHEDYMME